jgi:hypothetical protein
MGSQETQRTSSRVKRPIVSYVVRFGFCLFAAAVMGGYYVKLRYGGAGWIRGGLVSLVAISISIPLYSIISGRRDRTLLLVLVSSLLGNAGFDIVAIWVFVIVVCCAAVLDSIFIPPPSNSRY